MGEQVLHPRCVSRISLANDRIAVSSRRQDSEVEISKRVPASINTQGTDDGDCDFLLCAVIEPNMDDVALLRQTIRRCTALLVATLAITGVSLQRASEASLLVLIAVGAIVYLANEFFPVVVSAHNSNDGSEEA